jgi:hypothetical protein
MKPQTENKATATRSKAKNDFAKILGALDNFCEIERRQFS